MIVCSLCGGSDVLIDAYVHANDSNDVRTFDETVCETCGGPCSTEEIPDPQTDEDSTLGPRCPGDEQEAFAWGFMFGYLGEAPEEMSENFPDDLGYDATNIPEWLPQALRDPWRRGYDNGVAVYTDHAHPEDREA